MAFNRKNRINLLIGSVLAILVTVPTFVIVFGDARLPSFLPGNTWLWLAMWIMLLCGLLIALLGLMRRVHWGYFFWSQTTLSFLVLILYVGRYRTDQGYWIHAHGIDEWLEVLQGTKIKRGRLPRSIYWLNHEK